MNFDWIVAIVTFLVLTIFSFNYYTAFFVYQTDLVSVSETISDRIIDSIEVESYSVPIYFNATQTESDKILYADLAWPEETKNSVKVLLNDVEQPCMFNGDTIYWQSDVTEGKNMFYIIFSDVNTALNCDDTITIGGDRATPWSMETESAISQQKLDSISLMAYDNYRNSISVSRDVRIETDTGFSYGSLPPRNIDVYVFRKNITIAETLEKAELRTFVW